MKTTLLAIIQPINKGLAKSFSAYCPDIPGCMAHGPTEEKALEALQATLIHQLHTLKNLGLEPPATHCKIRILEVETVEQQQNDYMFANRNYVH
ncbi:MAG: type II toxin-antitoxin system HicB family antitoxin [Methylomicrobium sp.]